MRSRRWPGRFLAASAGVVLVIGCSCADPTPGSHLISASPSPQATSAPLFDPLMALEDFRTSWNETAALSAASDPLGIWRFEVAPGQSSVRIEWPDVAMSLDVGFDPGTTGVREARLRLTSGGRGRDAFVHGMAVLITVATPRSSLEQRVAIYTRLADACGDAGGGAFSASAAGDAAWFTLSSTGHGDATLEVAGRATGERSGMIRGRSVSARR